MKNKNTTNNLVIYLIILFVLGIFWSPINYFISIILVNPIFSKVDNHNIYVQLLLIGVVMCYYCLSYKSILKEKLLSTRRLNFVFIIVVFVLFRLFGNFEYYGINAYWPSYIDVIFIVVLIFETSLIIIKHIRNWWRKRKQTSSTLQPFTIDQPTQTDNFNRSVYAETLISKITSTFAKPSNNNNSFTVLLSECYGQGKTSFFELIKKNCETKKIELIEFKPWLSNDANQIIINFFDLLKEHLGENRELRKGLQSYAKIASNSITAKAVIAFINHNNSKSIESQHNKISEILRKDKKARIVLIDDVDRLQAEELLALIKLIRNSADFPYIAYIVAADKKALKDNLSNIGIKDANVYLKKFFNFELLFPADDNNLVTMLVNNIQETLLKFCYKDEDIKEIVSYIRKNTNVMMPVFKNPRDIYRFVNILSYDLDVIQNINNKANIFYDINISDFVKLCMIQYISPELYKILRDYPDELLEISDGKYRIKKDYENYINDRADYRYMIKVLDDAAKIKNPELTQNKKETDNPVFKDADDFINKAKPNEEEALKYIMDDLWSDNYVYDLRKICYPCQYFLYFAGKYRKNELSDNEAISLFKQPNNLFIKGINNGFSNIKDSLIHKLNIIILENKVSIIALLPNIVSLMDIDYQHYDKQDLIGFKDYYINKRMYQYIIQSLYSIKNNDKEPDISKLIEEHKAFFNNSKDYAWCSLYIYSMSNIHYDAYSDYKPLFTSEQNDEFARILTDNFFNDAFKDKPFDTKVLKTIPCIKMIDWKHWYDLFLSYVKQSNYPIEWFFRLFKISSDKTYIYWNGIMVDALCGNNPSLSDVAKDILGEEFISKSNYDFNSLNPNSTNSIYLEAINKNNFTKDAYDWLLKQ